jgi:hypothetical protein
MMEGQRDAVSFVPTLPCFLERIYSIELFVLKSVAKVRLRVEIGSHCKGARRMLRIERECKTLGRTDPPKTALPPEFQEPSRA